MKNLRRFLFSLVAVGALTALTACPKKTADLELDLAKRAIDDANANRASKCAKEQYMAAEAAIAEAKKLADEGEIEAAKTKALEAKTLAEQASAASPPGCDQPKEEEKTADTGPDDASADTDASQNLALLESAMDTIYFDYNDASIREDGKAVLNKVAQLMLKTPGAKIEIEGHCDIRGSTEYNLHLGERRARSVEKYLTTQGLGPDRISIISYGEERPADLGFSEEAHQKNRRAELRKR